MGRIYNFLGMTVGTIVNGQSDREKKHAYRCDITYGQNNEFGFDYLRDNMKDSLEATCSASSTTPSSTRSTRSSSTRRARRSSSAARREQSADKYYTRQRDHPAPASKDEDYTVDEKAHSVMLTDDGVERVEKLLGHRQPLRPREPRVAAHHCTQALRAHTLYKRDVNYLVDDGKVLIIDEFTGRVLPGRRWSRRPAPGGRGQGERRASRKRTGRWRRSPSRTSSASTRSWRA